MLRRPAAPAPRLAVLALAFLAAPLTAEDCALPPPNQRPAIGSQLFLSPQANPVALSCDGALVYVANTAGGTLCVLEAAGAHALVAEIAVGIDPVGVAVRPKASCADTNEDEQIFVTNHISDTISVVSRAKLSVVQTLQALDGAGVTQTDEPVGVAFHGPSQAFVTLDNPNQVLKLTPNASGQWQIGATRASVTSQAPRAIAAAGGRIFVAAGESGNQSEFPSCAGNQPVNFQRGNAVDEGCLFPLNFATLLMFAQSPNIGGEVIHDSNIPDRDLFVYDTNLGSPQTVQGVGTLLNGVAVSGTRVYVTHTDARNKRDGLNALANRMFENRLAVIDCNPNCSITSLRDLDQNSFGTAVPTPYGVAVSGNGQTVVVTAAGSDGRPGTGGDPDEDLPGLVTLAADGTPLGRVQTGAIPQGVALRSNGSGAALTAYVLNSADATLSVVNVANPAAPSVSATVSIGVDPTPPAVRRGRILFGAARASTSGTFSCESCHPTGNIDQILWVINTDVGPADVPTCDSGVEHCPEPRSTMPVRGLRDTLPLHWVGTLADPVAGVFLAEDDGAPDCNLAVDGEIGCIRHLVDASLSGVMCDPQGCPVGPAGQAGALDDAERDDMAAFLAALSFPPSPQRRPTDVLSATARQGVNDFFTDNGGIGDAGGVNTCADADVGCHALPLGVSTNSQVVGRFDAPSIRGLWDRHITFSNGITSSEEHLAAQGFDPKPTGMSELGSLSATFPGLFTPAYGVGVGNIWAFINEMSVGLPGLTGRQLLLTAANAGDAGVGAQLAQIESAAGEGRVSAVARAASLDWRYSGGLWLPPAGAGIATAALRALPGQLGIPLVVTAQLPGAMLAGGAARQPLLTPSPQSVNGVPNLPVVNSNQLGFSVAQAYVDPAAAVLVDGVRCAACTLALNGGSAAVTLNAAPSAGIHVVQVLNPQGFASNELPICSGSGLSSC